MFVVIIIIVVVVYVVVIVLVVVVDPRNQSLVEIGSVIAEILLTLSLCGGWVVVVVGGIKSFSCQTQHLSGVEVELGL